MAGLIEHGAAVIGQIQFAKPVFFWLLLALPLLWFRFRAQRAAVIVWRTLILFILIATLADPNIVTQQSRIEDAPDEERIFAFDLSNSIAPSMRRWMENIATGALTPTGPDRVFVFASEAVEVENWRAWVRDAVQSGTIRPEKTNLEKLLTRVLALPPKPRNLFLFTDGWENEGNVARLMPALVSAGVRVFPIVPAEQPRIDNVAVAKILAPAHGNSGEAINIRIVLENQSDREIEGTLALSSNGDGLKSEAVKLRPGSQLFTYQATLPDSEFVAYRASFTPRRPKLDVNPLDNQALSWVSVERKAKVLLLNGAAGAGRYLEQILKREGFEVVSAMPESPPPPAGHAIVVLNNVNHNRLSPGYMGSIERHVAQGNGFLILGNEASFAPGAYRRTPIEALIPVAPREPRREEKNRAVLLVIDKSGSMAVEDRMLYAQEAARLVARQLKDEDFLGVVGFDSHPFVVVPLSQMGSIRATVNTQISRLKPGGRTYLLPAMVEAKRQLEAQDAGTKHVIVLSDGETGGSGGDYIDLVNVMRRELRITVSTVAIGSDANIPLMTRIAQYGGGFFHHTYDPRTLPQIVLKQMQEKPKDEPADRDFFPVLDRSSELLAGLAQKYPSVRGHMDTDLKQGAQLDLFIPVEDRKAPVLASWRYGKGKSVALTVDLEGRATTNWIQWSGLQPFWSKVFAWLGPITQPIPAHETRVSFDGTRPVLDLYLYDELSANSEFRFLVHGKTGRTEGVLKRLARGHHQTVLPHNAPGDYRIELIEKGSSRGLTYPTIGYTVPYQGDTEHPRPGFNNRLLDQLAQATGGTINPQLSKSGHKEQVIQHYQPLRNTLIVLVFVLFLLEIAARRILFTETT